jgi:succinate dehydrogenase hydrophobic anchor subunit
MSRRKITQWLLLAATAVLLIFLKWLHLGVTNYNIFLLILIGWTLGLVLAFRTLSADHRAKK